MRQMFFRIINMVDTLKNNKCCIVEGKDLLLKCLKKESKSIDKSKIKDQRDHLKLLEEATKIIIDYKEIANDYGKVMNSIEVYGALASIEEGIDSVYDSLQDKDSIDGANITEYLTDAALDIFITVIKKITLNIVEKLAKLMQKTSSKA